MWVALACGFALFYVIKNFFFEDDTLLDVDSEHANAIFAVAKRLERLYHGSKVYVGVQIPDPDSASRQNIDLVLVTDQEAAVISVKNICGFISTDKDGNWLCTDGKHSKPQFITDPVTETKRLVSILEDYLERRGVPVPEGYLSCKVICPNPKFQSVPSESFPAEVITYDQWSKLKPDQKHSYYTGWIKGIFSGGKAKVQESFFDELNGVLGTAPISDRIELKGGRYVLGEFLEFKGKQEDVQALRKIRRSKVSRVNVQKISMFGLGEIHRVTRLFFGEIYR
ncbi:hypothetical protein M569_15399, partial [Genlisea aurea]